MFNVIYIGGTMGAFLCYFLHVFSKDNVDIDQTLFDTDGTVHNFVRSQKLPLWHEDFILKNFDQKEIPCVIPTLEKWTHYLYFTLSSKIRAGNTNANPDFLWQKTKSECEKINALKMDILHLQNKHYLNHKENKFSKKEIRDWYKQHFDNKLEHYFLYKQQKKFENDPWFNKQNCYKFNFEGFFYWDIFLQQIKNINKQLNLSINFDQQDKMYKLFNDNIMHDKIKQEIIQVDKVLNALKSGTNELITNLNVINEAFLLSQFEKFTKKKLYINDNFYSSTNDIIHQLK